MSSDVEKQYIREQQASGFKKGDYVKVLFKVPSRSRGWKAIWTLMMDDCVGGTYEVTRVYEDGTGISVSAGFAFPFFCLEKVDPDIKLPNGEVVVFGSDCIQIGFQTVSYSMFKLFMRAVRNLKGFCLTPTFVAEVNQIELKHGFTKHVVPFETLERIEQRINQNE